MVSRRTFRRRDNKSKLSSRNINDKQCLGCTFTSKSRQEIINFLRDEWRTTRRGLQFKKPCFCREEWRPDDIESMRNSELELLKHDVHIEIIRCGNRWKYQFISCCSEEVKEEYFRRNNLKKLEEKRIHEEIKISRFIYHLNGIKKKNNFPFQLLKKMTPKEKEIQDLHQTSNSHEGSEIHQVYVLKRKRIKYYVGQSGQGYPRRIFKHSIGHKSTINDFMYEDDFEENVVSEIMDIIQPRYQKYPCSHIIEHWLQREMVNFKFDLDGKGGKNVFSIGRNGTCDKCDKLAEKYGIDSWVI